MPHSCTNCLRLVPCTPSQSIWGKKSALRTTKCSNRTGRNSLLNVRLDLRGLQCPPVAGGLDHLGNQLRVLDCLAALHDPHDGRLCLEVPVRGHPLVRCLVLLFGLLELDLVDLDAHLRIGEPGIVGECVCRVDILAFGILRQYFILSAGK